MRAVFWFFSCAISLGVSNVLPKQNAASSPTWNRVRGTVLFIGYPRSGHTLVGKLIDAHPHIALATEYDALAKLRDEEHTKPTDMYDQLLMNSRQETEGKNTWEGYNYSVDGQWQGRVEGLEPHLIGDRTGGRDSGGGLKNLTARLRDWMRFTGKPLKLVHVVRNPWDTVGSMMLHLPVYARRTTVAYQRYLDFVQRSKTVAPLMWTIKAFRGELDRFFVRAETNHQLIESLRKDPNYLGGPAEIITFHYEDLVKNPAVTLASICKFLEEPCSEEYLKSSAKLVWTDPKRSRNFVSWGDLKAKVGKRAEEFPFLAGYGFAEDEGGDEHFMEAVGSKRKGTKLVTKLYRL